MTLRDAEAIVLETGKVPTLRRKGLLESLSMPAIESNVLEAFVEPLGNATSYKEGELEFPVSVERKESGLRMVVRRGKPTAPPRLVPVPPPSVTARTVNGEPEQRTESGNSLAALIHALAGPVAVARDRGASDVFVSTGQPIRIRVDGRLESLDMISEHVEIPDGDFAVEIDGTRLRVNAFEHSGGKGIAARLIKERVPQLADLGLPASLGQIVEHRDGLILVCGPTGSGKSTTLAALISLLDTRRAAHVITLEDPIEYRFTPTRCLIHQRQVGTHVPTFAAGLRAALREAPDVILLGELRDRETLSAALTAAETGHLVLATLHAPSAIGAIDRMIDAFPESRAREIRSQLSACARAFITQYLLPRRDGGRAAAIEYVPVTPAVANIIRKGDLHTLPTAIQSGRELGMIPLERSLAELIDSGAVSPQVVKRIAADHDLLSSLSSRLR